MADKPQDDITSQTTALPNLAQQMVKLTATEYALLQLFVRHNVPFQQPKEIKVFELGKKIFPIELVIVEKVLLAVAWLLVFVNPEKIIPLPLAQLDLYPVVDPEIKPQPAIQLPAKLIIF